MRILAYRPFARALALAIAGVLLPALTANASAACRTKDALYATTFAAFDDGWDVSSHLKLGHGKMLILPTPKTAVSPLYETTQFTSATVCADFTVSNSKGTDPEAGLIFWASDNAKFFQFVISPLRQYASIGAFREGKFKSIADWQKFAFIHTGKNAVNELAVSVRGIDVTTTINGKVALRFQATEEPPSPWYAGVDGEASSIAPATWTVTNFSVSK